MTRLLEESHFPSPVFIITRTENVNSLQIRVSTDRKAEGQRAFAVAIVVNAEGTAP